jgi:two-component system chemotaxis sensor kinase CheA
MNWLVRKEKENMAEEEKNLKIERALKMVAGRDTHGAVLEMLSGYSSTVVKQAFLDSKPIVLTGTDQGKALGSESAVLHNLRSIMAVPLKVRDKTIGVVYLDSHLAKGLFTDEDLELLNVISNYIAIAFETSRMARVEIEKANLQKELEIQSAIAAESKKVKIMVDNMQQALFSIDAEGRVVEPVSKYSETVLGRSIVDENILKVLYKDLAGEKLEGVRSAISTVFGEDELQWSLMEENFPRKIYFSKPSTLAVEPPKVLKILPSPIWDDREQLEKVLFVVEDVTSLEELEKQASESRKQVLIMEDILESKTEELRQFLPAALGTIRDLKQRVSKAEEMQSVAIFRDLHTLKGNARLYKLNQLSDRVHQSESELVELKKSKSDSRTLSGKFLEELIKIENGVNTYVTLFDKIYPSVDRDSKATSISTYALAQLDEKAKYLEKEFGAEKVASLYMAIRRLSYKSVKDLFLHFDEMAQEICNQLNKKIQFKVDGDALVDERQYKSLQECFLHIIRNSLDHGIETVVERVEKGKAEHGTISVICRDEVGLLLISIGDDGRGMDDEIIIKKAIEKKIVDESDAKKLSRVERLNLIFGPNFSTKETATSLSGRGIGMDVVKQAIMDLGGDLKLDTTVGTGSTFTISIATKK